MVTSIFIRRSGPASIAAATFQRSNRDRFRSTAHMARVKHAGGWAAASHSIRPRLSWTGRARYSPADWVRAQAREFSSGAWLAWRNRLALTFAHPSSNFPPGFKILSFTGIIKRVRGGVDR